ncbi:AAA family ATPase [Thermodesulfobacterium hveragerdense]|uniref:AAA family ATPase n=1 Tax=Thermodesulfobacterium hveragerdense TaxID=53424 RepID=UPI000413DA91|nr:SMC family ATPase [Thermodesulfobacterium hveragerdense]
MRPLFLSIKGFGPYLDVKISEEEFKKLSESRLFLISGEIGAGKTTLFDAIVYALYGTTTIEKRDPKALVSHLVQHQSNLLPEIEFKFFLDGKEYRIIRRLPFKDNKGKKLSLWIEGKFFSDKEKEVNGKIQSLIGLNAEQFKKVFLIPQGEYRKILLSDKKEREELFKLIFDTFLFAELEEFFKLSLKDLQNQLKSNLDRENQIKKLANINELKELEAQIKETKKSLSTLEAKVENLAKERENLTQEISTKQTLLSELKTFREVLQELENLFALENEIKQKANRLRLLNIIKEYLPFYEDFKKLKQEIQQISLKIKDLSAKKIKLSQGLDNLSQRFTSLSNQIPEIEELKLKVKELKQLEEKLNEKTALETSVDQVSKEVQSKDEEVFSIKEEIKKLKQILEETLEKLNLLLKIQGWLNEERQLRQLLEKFAQLNSFLSQKPELESKVAKLSAEIDRLEKQKQEFEVKNLALTVAKALEEGKPCPVCGSTFHPSPITDKNFTEELKNLEAVLTEKKRDFEYYKTQFQTLEVRIETLQTELSLYQEEELKEKLAQIETQNSAYSELVSQYQKNPTIIKTLKGKIKELKNALSQKERKEQELFSALETQRKNLLLSKGRLEELTNSLKALLTEEINLENLKEKIATEEKRIAEFENQKNDLEKQIKSLTNQKTEIEQDLKNQKEFLQHLLQDYKIKVFKLLPLRRQKNIKWWYEFEELKLEIEKIQTLEAEIKIFYQRKERLEAEKENLTQKLESLGLTNLEKIEAQLKVISQSLEDLTQKKEKLELTFTRLNQEIGIASQKLEQLEGYLKEYQELGKERERLEKKFGFLSKLWELISGKNPKGISFHSFVVSTFARTIFQRANQYLKEFSFGRYTFVEDMFLQKNVSIEVFDVYTGTKREVKTLSGGEAFIATLALALGTSDVITYLFKTKPFESLFIDEGFGSLDEKTLEKVINILLGLSEKSGRIIGVISHLEYMKEVFPVILEVVKDSSLGSKIRLIKK